MGQAKTTLSGEVTRPNRKSVRPEEARYYRAVSKDSYTPSRRPTTVHPEEARRAVSKGAAWRTHASNAASSDKKERCPRHRVEWHCDPRMTGRSAFFEEPTFSLTSTRCCSIKQSLAQTLVFFQFRKAHAIGLNSDYILLTSICGKRRVRKTRAGPRKPEEIAGVLGSARTRVC